MRSQKVDVPVRKVNASLVLSRNILGSSQGPLSEVGFEILKIRDRERVGLSVSYTDECCGQKQQQKGKVWRFEAKHDEILKNDPSKFASFLKLRVCSANIILLPHSAELEKSVEKCAAQNDDVLPPGPKTARHMAAPSLFSEPG